MIKQECSYMGICWPPCCTSNPQVWFSQHFSCWTEITWRNLIQGNPKFTHCTPRKLPIINQVYTLILEKAISPHSSTLAWKIPWTEEPGRLQSMGSQRVGHDWETSLSLFTFMHWRRKWQPTPVFLPGESQGWGSLVGWRLWGHTESDMTEVT